MIERGEERSGEESSASTCVSYAVPDGGVSHDSLHRVNSVVKKHTKDEKCSLSLVFISAPPPARGSLPQPFISSTSFRGS